MKKLSLYLAITLFISVGLFADGVQPIGSGTEADPYQVANLDNLLWVSTNSSMWDLYFIQTADIDAIDTINWNGGSGFRPIGYYYSWNSYHSFTGNYDGQNHIISNLFIRNMSGTSRRGLFGSVSGATISNIKVIDIDVLGNYYVGGLIGSGSGSIYNCYSSGIIVGNKYVGGLIGRNSSTLENSNSSSTVQCSDTAGGLVGHNYSTIINCFSTGQVSGSTIAGGLVGENNPGSISNCYSSSIVSGYQRVGGLVGHNYSANISNSYNKGAVSGTTYVGGLIGSNQSSSVNKCFNIGTINYSGSEGGGFVGLRVSDTINDSFWNSDIAGVSAGVGLGSSSGVTAKTISEMQDVSSFTDESTNGLNSAWDFVNNPNDDLENEDYWNIDGTNNDGYPYLSWEHTENSQSVTQQQTIPTDDQTEYVLGDVDTAIQFTVNHLETGIDVTRYFIQPTIVGVLPGTLENIANNYWTVISSAGDVGNYDITFDLTGVGGIGYFSTLSFLKRDDGASPWINVEDIPGVIVDKTNPPYFTIRNLTSFSDFVPAGENDNPLPVELSTFAAIQTSENLAQTNWTTQSENGLYGYNIYRSQSNIFNNSINLNQSLIEPTNSSTTHNYSYIDEDVEFDNTYYYWLESVELDGNTELYGPTSLTIESPEIVELPNATILNSAYPNPFNPSTTISFEIKEGETGILTIFNIKGQKIISKSFVAGAHEFKWIADNNSSGVYFYKLQTASYSKINKVLMLK